MAISSTPNPSPKQSGFDLEPDYVVSSTGTKHEFRNGLLVPTPEEIKRLAVKTPEEKTLYVVASERRTVVKMNPLQGLRLRRCYD